MSLESIIGQPFALDLCRQWLKRKTTNPLLFYGPEGAGKKALALEVAKALNCVPSPPPSPDMHVGRGRGGAAGEGPEPCGECLSCRKITAGNHPDVRVIDLAWLAATRKEPFEKQQALRIETVLAERHRLLQSSVEGPWKVSILDDAHRLTPDAANVFLKILEEPPATTAIILVTPFRDRLLQTIVSRCQPVRFRSLERAPQLSHEEIEAHRQTEVLWQSLASASPARLVQAADGRTRTAKLGRTEIEQQIQRLMVPAARALRAGEASAQESIKHLQNALTQLRQNVQPGLVYDNLLLHLTKSRRSKLEDRSSISDLRFSKS
jgi:DNA polymerase-3 subunit delta'